MNETTRLAVAALVALSALVALVGCGSIEPVPSGPAASITAVAPVDAAAPLERRLAYPPSRREPVSETIFGTQVDDPYRWLEDGKSPEVQRWMKAEDDFARAELARLAPLGRRDAFAARLAELLYAPAQGVPRRRGTRLFYARKDARQEKWVVCWKDGESGENGPEHVLLDPNTWSPDGSVSLGQYAVSWDGKRVAYGVRRNNGDEATIEVLDVATGAKSAVDSVPHTKFAAPSWTAKGDAFVYTYVPTEADGKPLPESERAGHAEIRRHVLGTPADKDEVVHEQTGDAKSYLRSYISEDGRWLFVEIGHGTSQDVYFRDLRTARTARAPFTPLVVGHDASFDIEEYHDHFYIATTDGAPNGRIVLVDPARPDPASWKELVAERKDDTLGEARIVGGKISIAYRKDVVGHLEIHGLDGTLDDQVALPGLGTAGSLIGRHDDPAGYFYYESYTHPFEIFRYELRTKKESSFFRDVLPLDPADYVAEEDFAPSRDGTRVPVFVVHRKNVQRSREHPLPTILHGYGGFDTAMAPKFWPTIIPWLDQGNVFAFASLRGGSDYGEGWHRAGMRHDKQNVFDDAIGVAELLVREGWTDPAHLAVRGRSNGGLMVGALATQRPDLFAVGLCGVPLLDMLRFDRFGSGKFWIDEYGSATNAADFPSLRAYSPYHHVTPGTRYPAMLFLSADSDDRVDPLHARKMTAEMQYASTGGAALLRIEKASGHHGADTVKSQIDELADEYAFALANMPPALPPPSPSPPR